MISKSMFVYIMASKTRRLYVGVTNNLVRRAWEHREGMFPGFTRRYGISRLVYFEAFNNPDVAIRREKQIKDYARLKKLSLIQTLNPEWDDLAESWFAAAARTSFRAKREPALSERRESLNLTFGNRSPNGRPADFSLRSK